MKINEFNEGEKGRPSFYAAGKGNVFRYFENQVQEEIDNDAHCFTIQEPIHTLKSRKEIVDTKISREQKLREYKLRKKKLKGKGSSNKLSGSGRSQLSKDSENNSRIGNVAFNPKKSQYKISSRVMKKMSDTSNSNNYVQAITIATSGERPFDLIDEDHQNTKLKLAEALEQLIQSEQHNDQLSEELEQCKEMLVLAKRDVSELSQIRQQYMDSQRQQDDKVARLQEELNDSISVLNETKMLLQSNRSRNFLPERDSCNADGHESSILDTAKHIEEDTKQLREQTIVLSDENNILRDKLSKKESEYTAKVQDLNHNSDVSATLMEELNQLQQEMLSVRANHQIQIEDLNAEIKLRDENITLISHELADTKDVQQQATQRAEKLLEDFQLLHSNQKMMQRERQEYESELREYKSVKTKELESMECTLINCKDEIETLRKEVESKTQEIAILSEKLFNQSKFSIENEKIKKELLVMKTENESNAKIMQENDSKISFLRKELSESMTTVENLKTELQQNCVAFEEYRNKVAEDQTTLRNIKSENFHQNEHLKGEVKHLQKQISELEMKCQLQENVHFDEVKTHKDNIRNKTSEIQRLSASLSRSENIRRKLHNKVMELKGNIRVFCRVRPVLNSELSFSENTSTVFHFPDYSDDCRTIQLNAAPKSHITYRQSTAAQPEKKWTFQFDRVFDPSSTQGDIFVEVSALVQSAVDGYRVCIFAYGQTGSGKTYTMQGYQTTTDKGGKTRQHSGLINRSISQIFNSLDNQEQGWDTQVYVEINEIYNDHVYDLLSEQRDITIRLDMNGDPLPCSVSRHKVSCEVDVHRLFVEACSRRSTKQTLLNNYSSRSHCIFTIRIEKTNTAKKQHCEGILHLIDLAGSERLSQSGSGNDPTMLKEAQSINKSLSCLGNVICSISKKDRHIPFRDSKLTHFLKSSLGGDSKTLMICNLSPLSLNRNESLNSLRFAKKVNSCDITYSSTCGKRND